MDCADHNSLHNYYQSILKIQLQLYIWSDVLISLQSQFLHPLSQQLLTALQMVDAYVHVIDGRDKVLARLTKLNYL